jgi:hypothetical protein
MRTRFPLAILTAVICGLSGCEEPTNPVQPVQPETFLDGFTPLSVGSFWKFEYQVESSNGHNGTGGSGSGTRTIEILAETTYPDSVVYHAALADTNRFISNNVGQSPDTTYGTSRHLFDITEQADRLRVSGGTLNGDNMPMRIFRSHSFGASKTRMLRLTGESALPGVDSVLVADDSGISPDNFRYYVSQALGIGPIQYGEDFGYPGGLITGSHSYTLKDFRIGK